MRSAENFDQTVHSFLEDALGGGHTEPAEDRSCRRLETCAVGQTDMSLACDALVQFFIGESAVGEVEPEDVCSFRLPYLDLGEFVVETVNYIVDAVIEIRVELVYPLIALIVCCDARTDTMPKWPPIFSRSAGS